MAVAAKRRYNSLLYCLLVGPGQYHQHSSHKSAPHRPMSQPCKDAVAFFRPATTTTATIIPTVINKYFFGISFACISACIPPVWWRLPRRILQSKQEHRRMCQPPNHLARAVLFLRLMHPYLTL